MARLWEKKDRKSPRKRKYNLQTTMTKENQWDTLTTENTIKMIISSDRIKFKNPTFESYIINNQERSLHIFHTYFISGVSSLIDHHLVFPDYCQLVKSLNKILFLHRNVTDIVQFLSTF